MSHSTSSAPAPADCGVCGRPADLPYRRVLAGRVTEGCTGAAHNAFVDAWAVAGWLSVQATRIHRGTAVADVYPELVALARDLDGITDHRDARNVGSRLSYVASRGITAGSGGLSRREVTAAIDRLVGELRDLEASPAARSLTYTSGLAIG